MEAVEHQVEKSKVILKKRREKFVSEGRRSNPPKPNLKVALPLTANKVAKNALSRIMSRKIAKRVGSKKQEPSLKRKVDHGLLKTSKCLLVMKNNRSFTPHKETIKQLEALRIQKPYSAVLISNTPEHLRMLREMNIHVIYGLLEPETIRKLLTTKAHIKRTVDAKDEGEAKPEVSDDVSDAAKVEKIVPLSTNVIVEEEFADEGYLCIEDMVHALVNNEDNGIQIIQSRLEPFQFEWLSSIEGQLQKFRQGLVPDFNEVIHKLL